MKKTLVILLIWIPVCLFAPAESRLTIVQTESIQPYVEAWEAVSYVESRFNPFAVNLLDPNGGSWGIVQIGQLKLDEYNEEHNTHYGLQDCFDVPFSKKVFMNHMMKYNDIETAIRAWNGSGPKTDDYWKLILERLSV